MFNDKTHNSHENGKWQFKVLTSTILPLTILFCDITKSYQSKNYDYEL